MGGISAGLMKHKVYAIETHEIMGPTGLPNSGSGCLILLYTKGIAGGFQKLFERMVTILGRSPFLTQFISDREPDFF